VPYLPLKKAVQEQKEQGNHFFSHFGPDTNLFKKIEQTFKDYGATGECNRRYYIQCSNARFTKVVPAPDEPVTTITGCFFDIIFSVFK
jgi:phosphoribulokinase